MKEDPEFFIKEMREGKDCYNCLSKKERERTAIIALVGETYREKSDQHIRFWIINNLLFLLERIASTYYIFSQMIKVSATQEMICFLLHRVKNNDQSYCTINTVRGNPTTTSRRVAILRIT